MAMAGIEPATTEVLPTVGLRYHHIAVLDSTESLPVCLYRARELLL